MKKQIQITSASIDDVMREMTKVAEELRKTKRNSTEYTLLIEYGERLNTRVELHLKAKETRKKTKEA